MPSVPSFLPAFPVKAEKALLLDGHEALSAVPAELGQHGLEPESWEPMAKPCADTSPPDAFAPFKFEVYGGGYVPALDRCAREP